MSLSNHQHLASSRAHRETAVSPMKRFRNAPTVQ